MSRRCVLLSLLGLASALSVPYPSDWDFDQTPFGYTHKPADLPHPDPTRSFWVYSPGANPLADEGSTGALTEEADVCIIGSGITGVSAAYHLANAVERGTFSVPDAGKIRAVIFEAREFCSGATGRNGGNLTPVEFSGFRKVQKLLGREDALRHYAIEHYSATEMVRIAREAGWADAVDLVEGGHMDVILTEDHLSQVQADFASAIFAGKSVNVSWLGREEMNVTYGTYNWGVRSPGYNLWPLKFATQLYEQSRHTTPQLELRLHTHTAVTSISPHVDSDSDASPSIRARRWTLKTPRGPVRCSSVLHATNAYASHLLPQLAGPAGILPVRGQVLALRAAAPLSVLHTTSWVGNEGYWFPRPVKDTSPNSNPLVILGGARTAAGPPFETDTTDDSAVDASVGRVLRDFLPKMFPSLYAPDREPEAEWTGIMGYNSLDIPFVGPVLSSRTPSSPNPKTSTEEDQLQYKGQFIAAGYAGHGMPRAFGCAEVVVQMIADELAGRESTPVPEWFPKAFLTWVRDSGAPVDEPESI